MVELIARNAWILYYVVMVSKMDMRPEWIAMMVQMVPQLALHVKHSVMMGSRMDSKRIPIVEVQIAVHVEI